MADLRKENQASILNARELFCDTCGGSFIFRVCEQERSTQNGWVEPKRCPACRKAERESWRIETERQERQKWQREKAAEKEIFETRVKDWNVVEKNNIHPNNDNVLYIIGNGFDLMHGVRSSYYAFRDSLGKENQLRFMLENFFMQEDIWADFENSLAHFDMRAMCSEFMVDGWLDTSEAYDEDAGGTEFGIATESAANPIMTVANELPRRFRMWVETLSIGTDDRPLQNMFRNGKVLCFNYTEFVETLYGVSESNVCYIHGCRRKKKYHPKEPLIIGHMPGASNDAYDFADDWPARTKDPYKRYMIEAAQDQVVRFVSESDKALTKNCGDIITAHEPFFSDLNKIENIIVIGHSLAPVDVDYFSEVASRLPDTKSTHWYFGCHGLHDLNRLEQLLSTLGIDRSAISVFRTDDIAVTPLKDEKAPVLVRNEPLEKIRCTSADKMWCVKTVGCLLLIVNRETQEIDCKIMFPLYVSNAFFVPSGEYLFAVINGVNSGIFLFRIADGHWKFVNELESPPNQGVINRRLCHVFLTAQKVTFVYNNRVRSYRLADGRLDSNKGQREARNLSYDGDEIGHIFLNKK